MAERMSIDERNARIGEIKNRLKTLNEEHDGSEFSVEARDEWNQLNEEHDQHVRVIAEDATRRERLLELAGEDRNVEKPDQFQTRRPGSTAGGDIYDLASVRRDSRSLDDENTRLRDNAMRSVEQASFPHPSARKEDVQTHIERLMENDSHGEISRRVLQTGSPVYKRAFGKFAASGSMMGLTTEEQRAIATTTTGVPIPYTLDPTVIPTSNFSVNPFRAVCRTITLTGSNQWLGVTSGAITSSYAAEATEATDNSPTMTQPSATVVRAQAFVPFSYEAAEDWQGLMGDLAQLFSDSKDDLEATKFFSGTGTVEPQGLAVGVGTAQKVTTASTATFVVADVYKTESVLAPRWRPRAAWVMNRAQANRIRQFDTAGGAQLWTDNLRVGLPNNVPTGGQLGNALLGYPAYELSTAGTSIASGSSIAYFGDFGRGMAIIDRIGMDIEVIPTLFGTVANFPTGQRGMYARWRNTSVVIVPSAFEYLAAL